MHTHPVRGRSRSRKQQPVLLLLLSALTPMLLAQSAAAPTPQFEVATVRPAKPDDPNSNINMNVGRFSTENVTIKGLLQFATQPSTQSVSPIEGAPAWMYTEPYDISAKDSEDTAKQMEALPAKARQKLLNEEILALLKERFALQYHIVQHNAPILALTVAKGGPIMQLYKQPADGSIEIGTGFHNDGQGHVEGRGATMAMLTDFLGGQAEAGGRIVVDQTGLTGAYNFQLHWTPGNGTASTESSNLPSLTAALKDSLGLELKRTTGPIETVVIDHIEKPTPN